MIWGFASTNRLRTPGQGLCRRLEKRQYDLQNINQYDERNSRPPTFLVYFLAIIELNSKLGDD
jgi:hypothetical protein